MKGLTALLAGAVTAVVAAGVWMAISVYANYEFGIIAWAVGAAVGFAVFAGSGRIGGTGLGLLAVVLALGGIALGKFGAAYSIVQGAFDDKEIAVSAIADEIVHQRELETGNPVPMPYVRDEDADSYADFYPADVWSQAEYQFGQMSGEERERLMTAPMLANSQYHIMYIADRLAEERMDAGERINWPKPGGYDEAFYEEDYPSDLWADATARWNAMTEDQQQQYRQDIFDELTTQRAQFEPAAKAELVGEAFTSSFNGFDILWGVLAIASAFKIGSAGSESRAAAT